MAVNLTVSKTLTGPGVGDTLRGFGSGYDYGTSETGATPTDRAVYLSHNGTNKIFNLCLNAQAYSGTYGGDYSAPADLTKLIGHGDAGDYGYQIDFRWDAATAWETDEYTVLKTGVGVSYATRILIPVEAMSFNNTGTEQDASAPVAGELGANGNNTLGDRVHLRTRYVNPATETQNGYRQFDVYFSYNFTT